MRDARLQLHWAAQIAAGVGRTLVEPRADDSHTSFTWSDAHRALLQEPVGGTSAGLRIDDLTLLLVRNGDVISELSLHGRTLDNGFAFLEGHYGTTLNRPNVDLPDHPVAHGATFDADDTDLATLARFYAEGASVCENVRADEPHAGAVRCWPHHFDIATLIDRGDGRTLGIGLSPGDEWYDEPYYYVTPWPYPDASSLKTLDTGQWHSTRWIGAVLRPGTPGRRLLVSSFIAEARRAL